MTPAKIPLKQKKNEDGWRQPARIQIKDASPRDADVRKEKGSEDLLLTGPNVEMAASWTRAKIKILESVLFLFLDLIITQTEASSIYYQGKNKDATI